MLCLGRSNFFRFNHPQEARFMKSVLPNHRVSIMPNAFHPSEYIFYRLYTFVRRNRTLCVVEWWMDQWAPVCKWNYKLRNLLVQLYENKSSVVFADYRDECLHFWLSSGSWFLLKKFPLSYKSKLWFSLNEELMRHCVWQKRSEWCVKLMFRSSVLFRWFFTFRMKRWRKAEIL